MENVGDAFGFAKKLPYEEGKSSACSTSMTTKVRRVWMGNCKPEHSSKSPWCMHGLNPRWFDLTDSRLFPGKYPQNPAAHVKPSLTTSSVFFVKDVVAKIVCSPSKQIRNKYIGSIFAESKFPSATISSKPLGISASPDVVPNVLIRFSHADS